MQWLLIAQAAFLALQQFLKQVHDLGGMTALQASAPETQAQPFAQSEPQPTGCHTPQNLAAFLRDVARDLDRMG